MGWNNRCGMFGVMAAAGGAWLMQVTYNTSGGLVRCCTGLVASLLLVSAMFAFHMSVIRCSESHTIVTLIRSYFRNQTDRFRRWRIETQWREMCRSPLRSQEKLLRKLTARDAKTDYGRKNHLKDIKTLASLQTIHPLTTYEHYQDYMKRLADGEDDVILADVISWFGVTSGTTGVGKLIPQLASRPNIVRFASSLSTFESFRCYGTPSPLQRALFIYCKPFIGKTKSGHSIAPALLITPEDLSVLDNCSAPPAAFQISTIFEAIYVQLVFALLDRNLGHLFVSFSSLLMKTMKVLEDNWQTMLVDITLGRLRRDLQIPDEIRRDLNTVLVPNPGRAEELRKEFSKGTIGIVSRLWPHLNYAFTIEVGGYQAKLEQSFLKGTPMYTGIYKSTETCIGLNLWPREFPAKYILDIRDNIFEFIPENLSNQEQPDALLLDAVKVGQRYELVLTTRAGLYRYRNGDVIEVVDIHDRCPVIRFSYRAGDLLNLRGEKVSAVAVQAALGKLQELLPGECLVNWTTAESSMLADETGEIFYFVFVEFEHVSEPDDVTLLAPMFDKFLRVIHHEYNHLRGNGSMAMARVYRVRAGSFQRLKEFVLSNTTASANQFKSPRKLRRRDLLDLMISQRVKSELIE